MKKIKLGFESPVTPNSFALSFLEIGERVFRPKIVRDKYSHDGVWVRFYIGNKKAWSCNYDFYKAHFSKVVP